MEPRKVQKVGQSTLSVSLPMAWTKKVGIQKGDLVFISEESDSALRLTTEPGKTENDVEYVVNVDRCDNTKVLARVIVGNYVLGRSLLRVESNRRLMREQIESIREVTHRLLGIGIIEESDRHLLLQCSIDPKKFPLKTVVRRLYVLTSIMFKETLDSIVEGDLELAKDAITREYEADTIYWLLARLLASAQQSRAVADSIGIEDPMDIVQHSIIAWYLEMIGDRVTHIASNVIQFQEVRKEEDSSLIERLSQIGVIAFNMFDKAVSSIFDGNLTIASDAVDMYDTIEREESTLMKRFHNGSNPELAAIISEIAWDLKIIAEHSSAIAEIAIDIVLKGENEYCHAKEV
ncbi:MAG: phosphate uptake regulator PhoU [Candidatus Bathyarchaeota archaeon]|nr:phosphate uptake regulator PhoU [Candidatus Bathyarchaeota archaeon]